MKRITDKSKKKKTRVNLLAKIIILLILIIFAISAVFLSGIFSIKKIEINIVSSKKGQGVELDEENSSKIQLDEVESLSGLNIGQNMFQKSKREITENIMKNPYDEDVKIKRSLNGVLSIEVSERKAEYMINYAGSYIYIDKSGYVLELSTETKNIPILLGTTTDFTNLAVGSSEKIVRLNDGDLEKLYMVNSIMEISKGNDISGIITRIDMSDDKNYIVYLDSENKTVYLGDCSELNTRILYMKSIVKEEAGHKGEIFINNDLNSSYVYFKEGV